MATVSCSCGNTECKATPHVGEPHCKSVGEPPAYDSGATFGSGAQYGVPQGWKAIPGDGAMCGPCAKAEPMGLDVSGGFDTEGALK